MDAVYETPLANGFNGHGRRGSAPSPVPIAIVGMACRFPGGATSPEELWELCATGRDAWSPIPESRFDVKSLYDENRERPGRNHATGGYFLQEDMALFDAPFFNFTSDVASAMDPQLRLLLEVVYEATEDAGLPIEKLAGPGPNTSVFTGCYTKDYHDLQTRDPESMPPSTLTGNYTAMFSNRISHFYDFQGASMSIDTGCSAALAALHQGCQTIRSGESEISIIGASNAILNPDIYIAMSSLGMVGTDGRCYAWDSRAQGYGRGEGVAVLILKSLDAALRDGDRVQAVIRGSGLNQDGKTTTITSPSMDAQIRLIRQCYQRAGLDLSATGYVEAHMTGTQAGDATEAEALAKTFGMSCAVDNPIWVGSVKTNIGHTEGVSGLAGIIKTAMAMKYRSIPPNLNYAVGNVKIPLEEWHLRVPTSLVPWPRDKPLRASINNFGYGGTNAHVILEKAPERTIAVGNGYHAVANDGIDGGVPRLYILSAQDPMVARTMAGNLAAHLRKCIESKTEPPAADLAFTLAERRSRLSWVAVVRARNLNELADRLEKGAALQVAHAPAGKKSPRLGFVFNGQGAQWHAMGRELLHTYPVFAAAIDEADATLREYGADWSLTAELMRDAEATRVSEIHLGQPITVALQICLVVLLRSWGVRPSAVTSHSSGEIAAAYAAGALSFEQALGVTYWRGELARTLFDHGRSGFVGGMAAAGVGPDEAERYANNTSSGGRVVVACLNSPESVTFSGDADDLDEVVSRLTADGKFARRLKVPLAYHSHHMLHMASAYGEKLRAIVPSEPTWPGCTAYTSPVTGGFITSADALTPEHYVRNLTSPVLFSQAFDSMCFGPDGSSPAQVDAIVEIGPHGALAGPIRQILRHRKIAYVSCLKRFEDAVETMQDMAAELMRLGCRVSLTAVNQQHPKVSKVAETAIMNFVPGLPTYPWNHTARYWVESRVNKDIRHRKFPPHELLGLPVPGATTPVWRNFLHVTDIPWMSDHRVDGVVVLPGAAYVSMGIEAARLVTDSSEKNTLGYRVRNVEFLSALAVSESVSSSSSARGVEMHLHLQPCHGDGSAGWYEFSVRSLGANNVWIENCRGLVSAVVDPKDIPDTEPPDADSFMGVTGSGGKQDANVRHVDGSSLRAHVAEMGIEYGPAFQGITDSSVSKATNRAVANLHTVKFEPSKSEMAELTAAAKQARTSYVIHPTTLDCIVQATYTSLPPGTGRTAMVLPRSVRGIYVPRSLNRRAGSRLTVFSELRSTRREGFISDASVVDDQGGGDYASLLEIDRLFCQAIPRAAESNPEILRCRSRWEPVVTVGVPAPLKDSMRIKLAGEEADAERKAVRASFYLISDAMAALEGQRLDGWTAHRRALFYWMTAVVARGKSGQLMPGSKAWLGATKGVKQILFDELRSSGGIHGDLTVRIGQNLAEIVHGDMTASELVKQDKGDLHFQYYSELPRLENRSYKHLARLARMFAANNPGANVLEIGAEGRGPTKAVLEALAFGHEDDGGRLVDRYILGNISSASSESSDQNTSASWAHAVEIRKLDLESEDPQMPMGLPAQAIDLIIASTVLHTVGEVQLILRKLRGLLKPAGKILLVVPTQDRLDTQIVFGTLPGWEENNDAPEFASEVQVWDNILRSNGFTGVEFDIGDCEQPQYQGLSVLLSSVVVSQGEDIAGSWRVSCGVSIVVHSPLVSSPSQQDWVPQLVQAIRANTGITAAVESLDEVQPNKNKVCILATDATDGSTVLDSLDGLTFDRLRHVLLDSFGILWLTSGGGAIDAPAPAPAQVQGLLRSLRQEDAHKAYALLDLPLGWYEEPRAAVGHVVRVLQQVLQTKEVGLADVDWEYAIGGPGLLYVPRVYPVRDDKKKYPETKHLLPFQQPGRALVWKDSGSGEGDFVEDEYSTDDGGPADGVVEIMTRAFGLDYHVRDDGATRAEDKGVATAYEIAGVITRLGPNSEASELRVGDRVCGVSDGPLASTMRAAWTDVARIPDSLSLEDAACVPLAYAGAYYALVHVARLREGDKVLVVHAADDHDGRAVLALASHMGADVWFSAANDSTQAEVRSLADEYKIPPHRILTTRDARRLAEAAGVDVIVVSSTSSLSARLLRSALESITHLGIGHFAEVGAPSKGLDIIVSPATRCATYAHVDMLQVAKCNNRVTMTMKQALEAGLRIAFRGPPFISSGPQMSLVSAMRFPVRQMGKTLQQVHQRGNPGKVVVVAQDDDLVQVVPHTRSRSRSLDATNATYLIFGGIDAIGGAIASWLVSKGAKNVLLASRSAEAHPRAASLVEDAAWRGCGLQLLNCDISSEESLVGLLRRVYTSLPPIQGVVHAASVLEDTVLERMSFAQWQQAVGPKVAGARNLHKHLPRDPSLSLVLLSSVTGVTGHLSQANYAAANAFEDALACRRAALGLPTVSLALPAVTGVGMVADDNASRRRVEALGTASIHIDDVLHLVEDAIRHPASKFHRTSSVSPTGDDDDAQKIVGLLPWARLPPDATVRRDRRFGTLRLAGGSSSLAAPPSAAASNGSETSLDPTALLVQALSDQDNPREVMAIKVAAALAARLAAIFNVVVESVDLDSAVSALGVDSLVAVELRNWLASAGKAKLSIFEILQSPSVRELAGLVTEKSRWASENGRGLA